MNLSEYKTYWLHNNEALHVCKEQNIDKLNLNQSTYTFVTTWGLPAEAAPFLSFSEFWEENLLPANEVFQLTDIEFNTFLMFGSNGSGDPICIDTGKQDEIVCLNHDNDYERVFINQNIYDFARA